MSGPCGRGVAALFAALVTALVVDTTTADAASVKAVHVGFDGHYKLGSWTPVVVDLAYDYEPEGLAVSLETLDGDGVPTVTRAPFPVLDEEHEHASVTMYVKFGRPHPRLNVRFDGAKPGDPPLAEPDFIAEVPAAMSADQTLTLELGAKLDVASTVRFTPEGEPVPAIVTHIDRPEQLPDRWQGYAGVDLVIITASDAAPFEQLSSRQLTALHEWLSLGGKMLFSIGGAAPQLIAAHTPLARFAPGKFADMAPLDRFAALENFAGSSAPLETAVGDRRPTLPVARLSDVQGRVESAEGPHGEMPLVIRAPVGFGQLTFFAADLAQPPLSNWSARQELISALLGRGRATAPGGDTHTAAARLGFNDMIGQLRASLDQFPGVQLIPFSLVILLAVTYLLCLFPLDYFLSRGRGGGASGGATERSAAWPWLRLALLVLLFGAAAITVNRYWKAGDLAVNRVDLVDVDLASGLERGQSWLSVYSPHAASYRLDLSPSPTLTGESGSSAPRLPTPDSRLPTSVGLSWLGLPGAGVGAMKDTPAEAFPFSTPYAVSFDGGQLGPAPIAAQASKSFTAEWTAPDAKMVDADLHDDGQLGGTIRVVPRRADDNLKLNDCVLFYDRWAYTVGALSINDPIKIDAIDPQVVETYLCRRRKIGEKDVTAPYDPASLDRGRVLQIMMNYKAAGGRRYTGLMNRGAANLDLSDDYLQLGRAVLVGVGPPAVTLTIDGQATPTADSPAPLSVFRFVLPVAKGRR